MTAGVSKEKQDLMRLYGAEIVLCPPGNSSHQKCLDQPLTRLLPGPVRRDGVLNPTNYRVTAERIANEKGGVYTNQFDNVANFLAHYNGTGPEIYRQSRGKVDAFVCASGTGGTISGVSNFLKDTNPAIKIFLADCDGSALASKVLTGKLELFGSGSFAEGIGNSMITGNHGRAVIDDAVRVRYCEQSSAFVHFCVMNDILQHSCMYHFSDKELLEMGYFLLRNDALFVGPAAALNACAAVKVARKLGPGHNVVTILCDGGDRYISKVA
jgi:cysteine synthase A